MTITFADGTRIDVPASAFNDFLKHDLPWAEFVHGRASDNWIANSAPHIQAESANQNVHRCPARGC